MKRFLSLFLFIVFSFNCFCLGFAEEGWFSTDVEIEENINLGVSSSIVFPNEDDFLIGLNVEGVLSYDVLDYAAIGIETGYTTWKVKGSGNNIGRLNLIPILGDVILKYPMDLDGHIFVPYLTNGFGVLIADMDESRDVNRLGIAYDIDTSFLYKLAAGMDLYVNDSFALTFETSYQWSTATWTASDSNVSYSDTDFKADAFYLGGGFKIKF